MVSPPRSGTTRHPTGVLGWSSPCSRSPGRVPELEGRRTLLVLREPARSPVAGRYVREGDTLRFTPVVPFSPGERYRIELHEAGAELRVQTLEIPAEAPSVPAVAAVFPSVARVPANQLKFTARFATPMHVRRDGMGLWGLVDVGTGERVPAAFRDQPLWNLVGPADHERPRPAFVAPATNARITPRRRSASGLCRSRASARAIVTSILAGTRGFG